MPKILADKTYDGLKAKADNYDALVASVVANAEDITAEEVSVELLQEAISTEKKNDNAENVDELKAELQTVTAERDSLTKKNESLTAENAKLKELPSAESVTDEKPKSDAGADEGEDTLLAFASKNADDTFAVVEEMRKYGYGTTKN